MFLAALTLMAVVGFVVVPRVGFALAGRPAPTRALLLPWVAVGLFIVAWVLPNPDLEQTDTFVQHAVGGGASSAVFALYLAINLGLEVPIIRIGLAFVVAAAYGTVNELVELVVDQWTGGALTADTSWDLLANSVGAVGTAVAIEVVLWVTSARPVRERSARR